MPWASPSPVAAPAPSSTRGCSSRTSSRPTSPTSAIRRWSRHWPWSTADTVPIPSPAGDSPSRSLVTKDNLVVLASEAGVLPVPPEQVRYKGRLQPGKMFLLDLAEGRIIGDDELKGSVCRAQPYGLWLEKHQIGLADLPEPA